MRDEMFGRLWDEHHEALSDAVDRAVEAVRLTLCKLRKIQFDAPWRQPNGQC